MLMSGLGSSIFVTSHRVERDDASNKVRAHKQRRGVGLVKDVMFLTSVTEWS
jgi:hypothetical protein